MRIAVKFVFLNWGTSKEYATSEETDWKGEQEHSPNNVNYYPVNEQCRKKSHVLFLRRDVLYHQDYQGAENSSVFMCIIVPSDKLLVM